MKRNLIEDVLESMHECTLLFDSVNFIKRIKLLADLPLEDQPTTEQIDLLLGKAAFGEDANKEVAKTALNIFESYGILSKENNYSHIFSLFGKDDKMLCYIVDELLDNDISNVLAKTNGRFLVSLMENGCRRSLSLIFDHNKELIHSKIDPKKKIFSKEGLSLLSYVILKNEKLSGTDTMLLKDLVEKDSSIKNESFGRSGEPYTLINAFEYGSKYNKYGVNFNLLRDLSTMEDYLKPDYSSLYKGQNIYNIISLFFLNQDDGNKDLVSYMDKEGILKGDILKKVVDNNTTPFVDFEHFDLSKMTQENFDHIQSSFCCGDSLRELSYMTEQIENKKLFDSIKSIDIRKPSVMRL